MDSGSQGSRRKLAKAVEYAFRHLAGMRSFRQKLIREYAGDFYAAGSADSPKTKQYCNLLQLTAEAYAVSYAYQTPRFLVTTHNKQHKAFARRFQEGLNGLAGVIELGETLRAIVLDAFFYMGVAKVYLADSAQVTADEDPYMAPSLPFVGRVSPDDFMFDIGARDFRRCGYIGDRYRMVYDEARRSPRFDTKAAKLIVPNAVLLAQRDPDTAAAISQSNFSEREGEYQDMVDLCDIYLPREKKILTYQVDSAFSIQNYDQPLSCIDWDGSELGPYEVLGLTEVPDNIMPTSLAGNVRGLYILFNNLLLKLSRRANRQKNFVAYQGSEADAKAAQGVEDGGLIQLENPESIKDVSLGGIDGPVAGFALQILELYKQHAGNPDLMMGVGPASGTATQDVLISRQANKREAAVRQRISKFVSRLGIQLAELMWDDPLLAVPGEQRVEGTSFTVDASWYPPSAMPRQGTFADYQCEIEPYSTEFKTPGQRSQELSVIMQEIYPLMQLLQQQGKQINMEKLLQIKSEYHNLPELLELFEAMPLPDGSAGPPAEQPSMDSHQPREYIRRNVSSGAGKESALVELLQGQGSDS